MAIATSQGVRPQGPRLDQRLVRVTTITKFRQRAAKRSNRRVCLEVTRDVPQWDRGWEATGGDL